jgi:lysozyme family protein
MRENYDRELAEVLEQEGGYSNDPGDPGGPTKYGITIWDARMYWKHDAAAADVCAMPLDVAKQIYRSKYWDAISGDDLPSGVDLAVFDYGVNSGIHRAAMMLQRLINVPDDGIIGPVTLAAVKLFDPARLAAEICDERLAFLQGLRTWRLFGRGWGRRVREVKALALELATGQSKPESGAA